MQSTKNLETPTNPAFEDWKLSFKQVEISDWKKENQVINGMLVVLT